MVSMWKSPLKTHVRTVSDKASPLLYGKPLIRASILQAHLTQSSNHVSQRVSWVGGGYGRHVIMWVKRGSGGAII